MVKINKFSNKHNGSVLCSKLNEWLICFEAYSQLKIQENLSYLMVLPSSFAVKLTTAASSSTGK